MSEAGSVGAGEILRASQDALRARAEQRDRSGGERSMAAAVVAFNALTDHRLTETQGWLFMAVLKASRSQGGGFVLDDYVDGAAYFGLAGEAAAQECTP